MSSRQCGQRVKWASMDFPQNTQGRVASAWFCRETAMEMERPHCLGYGPVASASRAARQRENRERSVQNQGERKVAGHRQFWRNTILLLSHRECGSIAMGIP